MAERRTVRIAADDRARVPFAMIGVLLLVSSVAYAGALQGQNHRVVEDDVERAMERSDAALSPTIRSAATAAAYEAGASPVTSPPEGPAAAAIRDDTAFEDALRIRIALAVSEALDDTERRVGDVDVRSSVPSVADPENLVAARDRVDVGPVANGTATRVTVRNVTSRATRDDRILAEETRDVTVVVAVPVLTAHERVERYETRLNRGALAGPGLGRQLTGRLYPVTWARGYAQYRGAPVQNVLANRHVELSTNAGMASLQRETFGAADPAADAGVRRATERTGVADLLDPTSFEEDDWSRIVTGSAVPEDVEQPEPTVDARPLAASVPAENETTSVSAAVVADAALVETIDAVGRITWDAYRADATLEAERTLLSSETDVDAVGGPVDEPPGSDWWLVESSTSEDVSVAGRESTIGDGFGTGTRTVTVTETTMWRWSNDTASTTTKKTTTDRYRVSVTVSGTYSPTAGAPDGPTNPIFERGGALDGPNLAGVPAEARRGLGAEGPASVDAIARDVATSGPLDRTITVVGDRPSELDPTIRNDLASLHGAVRNLSVEVSMRSVAAGEAEPYAELATAIRDRRATLVDAPTTYDGAADRARVAARAAYVDAVVAELERAANTNAEATDAVAEEAGVSGFGADSLGAFFQARDDAGDPDPYRLAPDGPGGGVELVPRGSPGYLPRTAVEGESVSGMPPGSRVRPMATRNVNYVTAPYGDVATGIVDRFLGTERTVSVRDGGRALVAANRALEEVDDADLRANRDELEDELRPAMDDVNRSVDLAQQSATTMTGAERRAARQAAAREWAATGPLAIAMGNGSYAAAVTRETAQRTDLSPAERELLEASLRSATGASSMGARVEIPASVANRTLTRTHDVARTEIEDGVQSGIEYGAEKAADRWAPNALQAAPTGVPIVTPGGWYATVNVWRVEVAGEYPRFSVVAADRGPPGSQFEYVREPGPSTVTVAGETVSLGETDPVRFETETVVVVAVPPGPPGVGDVDGDRDETSPGWPCPGSVGTDCESAGGG